MWTAPRPTPRSWSGWVRSRWRRNRCPGAGSPIGITYSSAIQTCPPRRRQRPGTKNLEFRGHRGIIIPLSLHKSGNRYERAPRQSPDDLALPELPAQVVESLRPPPRKSTTWSSSARPRQRVTDVDASPRTLDFLSGKYANGPHWNDRLFQAACDLCGRDMPMKKAERLLLDGAQPWNAGEEELARRTIESGYSQVRTPARL